MKLKLAAKLGLGFGLILLLTVITAFLAYRKTEEVRAELASAFEVRLPQVELAKIVESDLHFLASKTRQNLLAGGENDRRREARKAWNSGWETLDKDMSDLAALAPRFTLQENRDRVASIGERLPRLREIQAASMALAENGERDAIVKAGNQYMDAGTPFDNAIVKTLNALSDSANALLKNDEQTMRAANRSLYMTLLVSTVLSLVVGIAVAIFLSRKMSSTTNEILNQASAIADGDLAGEELKVTSQDELGDLTVAVNRMQGSLRKVILSISENSTNVANASEEFSAVSQQITTNSEETSAQANAVSSSTEQVTRNLTTVATATEEMSASISEIAKNATESARVASSAMKTASETNTIVMKLGESSREIGQVIKVITSIAQKTDLLALNATVEAARAGEVGAGFAVVANEVKELAKQTSNATEDISRKIEAIQTDAKAAVGAIGSISGIIAQVNEIAGTIAAAVEEQSATSREMSRNLMEAAKGAEEVAQNIQGVAQAAQNTSHGASDSLKAAKQLAESSTKLRSLVDQFKLENREDGNPRRSYRTRARRQEVGVEAEEREEVMSR
jgi:methyl-accepting chemotaxis protein